MTNGFENAVEGLHDLLQKNPELEAPVTTIVFSMCGLVSAYQQLKERLVPDDPIGIDDPYGVLQVHPDEVKVTVVAEDKKSPW